MEWLKGKKTYIIAAVVVLLVLLERVVGIDIPGVEITDDWGSWIIAAGGLTTLRAGIAKKGIESVDSSKE